MLSLPVRWFCRYGSADELGSGGGSADVLGSAEAPVAMRALLRCGPLLSCGRCLPLLLGGHFCRCYGFVMMRLSLLLCGFSVVVVVLAGVLGLAMCVCEPVFLSMRPGGPRSKLCTVALRGSYCFS